jgi:hypothetical protein
MGGFHLDQDVIHDWRHPLVTYPSTSTTIAARRELD